MSARIIPHDLTPIMERIANGERQLDIAKSLGVTQQSLSAAIRKVPEFMQAREVGAIARMEAAEVELDNVPDDATNVAFSRTKEKLSHARWRLEREFSKDYGRPDATPSGNGSGVTIIVHRGQDDSVVIEHD